MSTNRSRSVALSRWKKGKKERRRKREKRSWLTRIALPLSLPAPQVLPLSGPKNLTTFGNWKYDACYKDLVNNQRVLPTQLSKFNFTIEGCLNAATTAGANVAGLSYYHECWYSTDNVAASSYTIDDTNCRFPCEGNPNEFVVDLFLVLAFARRPPPASQPGTDYLPAFLGLATQNVRRQRCAVLVEARYDASRRLESSEKLDDDTDAVDL